MKSEKKIIKKNSSSFLDTLKGIFTNKIVLVSLSITFFLIIFFHFASTITLPGIEVPTNYKEASTSFVGMLNLLAGGGLTRMSLFAVGVGPYITAQIISQLLSSDLIKPLSKLAKAGERGRKKIEILTRIITLPFAVAQSYAVIALILNNNSNASADQMIKIFGHDSLSDMSAIETFSLIGIFSAGTYISIFIGDMITKRGVGNGVTLLILVGIVSSLFSDIQVSFLTIANKIGGFDNSVNILSIVLSCFLYILFFIIVLFIIIFVNDSVRKIPIQQTGQGLITDIDSLPYLPIKVNAAGVIPVIFASSIMTIPGTIAQFLSNGEAKWFITNYLVIDSVSGLITYFFLIFIFVFFYSYIQINPQQLAENFEKSGKFIPGVKMGTNTEKHITKVLTRINWIGAPFLGIVAILPYVISMISGIPSGVALGGTSLIIIVSATIELWNSIKSASTITGYSITRTRIQSKIYESSTTEEVQQLW